jgi:hypothetical protein
MPCPGYSSTIVGDFSISIDRTDGLTAMNVYVEDKLTNISHDLSLVLIHSLLKKGLSTIVLTYKVTLGTDDFETVKSGVIISSKNKEIKIQSKVELIDKVMVYDVSGKLIQEKKKIENTELILSGINAPEQVLS